MSQFSPHIKNRSYVVEEMTFINVLYSILT